MWTHPSKSMCKKISKVAVLDEIITIYTTSAYIIAQLSKNFALPSEQRINGFKVLKFRIINEKVKLYQLLKFIWTANKIYVYCRINTPKQNIEHQTRNILKEFPETNIIKETYTGSRF